MYWLFLTIVLTGGIKMKKITKISIQQNGERYNLFLDDEFFCGITEDTLIKMQLKKGMMVDEKLLGELAREELNNKCFNYAVFLLGKRNYFEKVLMDKLKEKEYDEEAITFCIERLHHYGYLSDARLSMAYVNDQKRFLKKGPRYIANVLRSKGVTRELIEESLEAQYQEEEALENCKSLVHKKLEYYRKKTDSNYALKGKLYAFLAQKGYKSETIKCAIEDVLKEAEIE